MGIHRVKDSESYPERGEKKARSENFITRFAKYYTPIVVFTALALAVVPPLVLPGAGPNGQTARLCSLWFRVRARWLFPYPRLFGGIGGASRNGILIKGAIT